MWWWGVVYDRENFSGYVEATSCSNEAVLFLESETSIRFGVFAEQNVLSDEFVNQESSSRL